jgi:peptide/nickel transport system substrate-binding protein
MTLASNSIPTEANNYGGSNYPGWANPEFDAAIIAAARELDPIKRQAIWTQMQRLYADDLPVIPLYFRVESFVLPQWLKGIRPTGHAVPSTAWVEDWHVQP